MGRMNLLSVNNSFKEKFRIVLLLHVNLQKLQPQCMISAGGRQNNVFQLMATLLQKALSLYKDFSKRSPKMSDTKSREGYTLVEWLKVWALRSRPSTPTPQKRKIYSTAWWYVRF
jgi:hypothetical protein